MLRRSGVPGLVVSAGRGIATSRRAWGLEEFVQPPDEIGTEGSMYTGRAWRASELRLKSFDELHQLWFVLLKEKNRLLTDRAAQKYRMAWMGHGRLRKVKESMARLKTVLRERTLVYQDTQKRLEARYQLHRDQERKLAQQKS